jgi:hypothetical protein
MPKHRCRAVPTVSVDGRHITCVSRPLLYPEKALCLSTLALKIRAMVRSRTTGSLTTRAPVISRWHESCDYGDWEHVAACRSQQHTRQQALSGVKCECLTPRQFLADPARYLSNVPLPPSQYSIVSFSYDFHGHCHALTAAMFSSPSEHWQPWLPVII